MDNNQKRNRSSWLTSILIGTAVASVAGALYVAKDKKHGGTIKAIRTFASDVVDDSKTIYRSLTIDNLKQLKKITSILSDICNSTLKKLNVTKYFKKKSKNKINDTDVTSEDLTK